MNRIVLLLSLLLMLSLACGTARPRQVPADEAATAAAQTVQAASNATPPASPAGGLPLTIEGISLVIPNGLASGGQSELVPESNGLDLPYWEVHPAYTRITLQGYPLQGKFFQPEIYIYPADQFGQLSAGAAQAINDLKQLLTNPAAMPEAMPFLPIMNAAQVFYSNPALLSFQNGRGFRYLTQYDQALLPVNNNELFYTFQGLTQDERFYVSAILPINASFLSADGSQESPLPPGGVPFDWNNFETMPGYLQAVRQQLESASPEQLTPTLAQLDALIQSLLVNLP